MSGAKSRRLRLTCLAAVSTLADADVNEAYRAAISRLNLPTWAQFAHEIATWASSDVAAAGRR